MESRRTVRKDEGKHREKYPKLEADLLIWFANQRKAGLPVNTDDLKVKAIEIYNKSYADRSNQFKASNGWLEKFLKRSKLSMRQATSIGQKIPNNVKDIISNFFEYIRKLTSDKTVLRYIFANMDETPPLDGFS